MTPIEARLRESLAEFEKDLNKRGGVYGGRLSYARHDAFMKGARLFVDFLVGAPRKKSRARK